MAKWGSEDKSVGTIRCVEDEVKRLIAEFERSSDRPPDWLVKFYARAGMPAEYADYSNGRKEELRQGIPLLASIFARGRWLESLPPKAVVWTDLRAALEDACADPGEDRVELVRALCEAIYSKHCEPDPEPDETVRQACRRLAMQLERRISDASFLYWLLRITVDFSANDGARVVINDEIERYLWVEVMPQIRAYLRSMVDNGRLHSSEAAEIELQYERQLLLPD